MSDIFIYYGYLCSDTKPCTTAKLKEKRIYKFKFLTSNICKALEL